ncbi:LysR family transcriptional regulator [Brachyspira hyodysenteriae]|uniref:LysR family transcriptional regulator n=1 Tax=Brachyspira hyodysenteriae TaxID=159 RepID=UPI00063DD0A3|nr:LysR family transcriptional regulator [Brachyspira hyodysenteriae]KLI21250.1 LysR family transcriptional regulator [Brachyspira hyodysenteriae]MCZ9981723.1 LysR family transcriptional regulator [Brachyspira hyodysenteriae]TVL57215.1 LysR family transcriptional regulator [Brachyspira hyodysenteriae]TVL62107.1 LysR family transcriptional regulator [Brachyspira hyodysenteriae]TVL68059.1 LysR family transcriptional regulator [Brachyspira hyodysenteriae]
MEIRALKYFLTTVREGNITKAAKYLNLTQPNLSRQINILERDIGHKLFERKHNNIVLTPEGILLKKRAEEIIDMIEKTRAEFNFTDEVIAGDIFIGAGETWAMSLLASVMKEMQSVYPHIRYNIYSGNFNDITEKLDKGLLDFGVLIDPADLSKYDYLKIPAKDTWGVIMRKDSELAKKKYITKTDLLDLPLIMSRQAIENKLNDNDFIRWFGDSFDKLNIAATYNLLYNALIMVKEGMGYALSLDKLIDNMHNENICFIHLKPKLESGLNIVWKKNQEFSRASKIFLDRLTNEFNNKI